ncbi:acyltransferase family protein [Verrucomicrobium spinosum]|uniref:acyltransferase family protein n=1 Tax=Verrucomicrobium spinosum TaxID=2736 RepID=UPI00017465B2|nr:acyltransferase [Verrucomicrobium spinosum]
MPDLRRIPQLDGIRGIAILMVLVWHYVSCSVIPDSDRLARVASKVLGFTWSGVDLFFVLSGFLITNILLLAKNSPNVFATFYIRRAFRILPLYYLLFASFVGVVTLTPLPKDPRFSLLFENPLPLGAYATFTQNIFMGIKGGWGPHWIAVTWSLAVEEQFYLLAPFAAVLLPRRIFISLVVAGIVFAPALRWLSPGFHAFVNTPWRLDSLLMGSLLAIGFQHQKFLTVAARHFGLLAAMWVSLLAVGCFIKIRGGFTTQPHFLLALGYGLGILLTLLRQNSPHGRALAHPILVWFGVRSYAIYLLHQPVNGLLHGFILGRNPQLVSLSDAWVTSLALVATLALAALSFRWLEQPLLRFSHRFQYRGEAYVRAS